MEKPQPRVLPDIAAPDFEPEQMGAGFWYEQYLNQRRVRDTPVRRHQIAELVEKPVEVWEYQRPCYQCRVCRWQGYAELPLGCREDFSYGAWLSSLVGWLGYGGN
jgi:hypothetical protein